jgi:hypothetical protein
MSPPLAVLVVSLENPQIIDLAGIFVKTFDRLTAPLATLSLELSRLLFYPSEGRISPFTPKGKSST